MKMTQDFMIMSYTYAYSNTNSNSNSNTNSNSILSTYRAIVLIVIRIHMGIDIVNVIKLRCNLWLLLPLVLVQ